MAENRYLDELFGTARSNDTCLCMTPNLSLLAWTPLSRALMISLIIP